MLSTLYNSTQIKSTKLIANQCKSYQTILNNTIFIPASLYLVNNVLF